MKGRGLGEIILVGVIHGDPEGYKKLIRLLALLRPLFISVEISEYSWHYRRRHQARWQRQFQLACQTLPPERRRHLALQRIAAQISFPFEAKAAADYARENGIGWGAVDLNAVSREHLPRYETELLSPDNLNQLVSTENGDWQELLREEYQRARLILQLDAGPECISNYENVNLYSLPPQTTLREKVLAHRVARLAKEWTKIVHVGGWEHLVRAGRNKTMADFLLSLQPLRLLLDN